MTGAKEKTVRSKRMAAVAVAALALITSAGARGIVEQHDHGAGDHHHADTEAPSHHDEPQVEISQDHENDAAHDHARDHDHAEGAGRFIEWIGRFHPVVVHMPIALLFAAAAAEILTMVTGANGLAAAARFCLALGALGAAVAAPLGWANAAHAGYAGELASVLTIHRGLGTSTAVWALGTWGIAEAVRRPRGARWRPWYRAALIAGAVAVGVTAHFGGTLVFGPGYYAW